VSLSAELSAAENIPGVICTAISENITINHWKAFLDHAQQMIWEQLHLPLQ
jgi:hypothetical protein